MFSFISQKITPVLDWFSNRQTLTAHDRDEFIKKIKDALLEADVPLSSVNSFTAKLTTEINDLKITRSGSLSDVLTKKLYDNIVMFLSGENQSSFDPISFIKENKQHRLMMVGLQGSGKTTSITKLSQWILDQAKRANKKIIIGVGSVDFYRPAAREQLAILAQQIGITYFDSAFTNPEEAANDLLAQANSANCNIFILDTAGRMQVNADMMDELQELKKIIEPTHTVWVVDGMTGQESLAIGKSFSSSIGIDSIILSKMDSETRGGIAFGLRYELKKPICFVGTGEKPADLEQFMPDRMASRIIGMGDLSTLLERADRALESNQKSRQEAIMQRMMSGELTLEDFAEQMRFVGSMGPIGRLVQYLPGVKSVPQAELDRAQVEMVKFQAIVNSMTPKERRLLSPLTPSRKNRIATGSGASMHDIDGLLQKFEQSKQFAKMLKKMGGVGSLFR